MKTKYFGRIASILMLAICGLFVACDTFEKPNAVVNYTGTVVYLGTSKPFADVEVRVTDGFNIHRLVLTDTEGKFSLKTVLNDIDGDYYILVGDSTCVQKKVNFPGFGQATIDVGTIDIEGPSVPAVTTKQVTAITANSASCGGKVTSDGRSHVTARGVCYSKSPYPTIEGSHTSDGTGTGDFVSNLKDLEFKGIYYVRAYATNKIGTGYGEQIKFTTEEGVAVVVTDSVYRITAHSARCHSHIDSDGGFPVTKRGVCWSTRPDPTTDDDFTDDGSNTGEYTSNLQDLKANTTYYIRAYATNSTKTSYGEQFIFTTQDGLAVVKTDSVATVLSSSFVAYGNVIEDCDIPVITRGFCYAKTQYPTTSDNIVTAGQGLGTYKSTISGLERNTIYFVCAYATNGTATSYGEQIMVTTLDGMPLVVTNFITGITAKEAIGVGHVIYDGGSPITERGICWSTHQLPTLNDSHVADVVYSIGSYELAMTGLSISTAYYVRAYATNENGTAYGEQIMFTSDNGLPKVETYDPKENITASSIGITGQIISNGGFAITERGFVYSTLPFPTIGNANKNICDGTEGYFSTLIDGIDPTVNTYYIRAYATNTNGTAYGEQIVVTPERSQYLALPTVIYGGYKYHVYKDMGAMNRATAVQLCEDLTFAGYDDWYLPDQYELRSIAEAEIDGWVCTSSSSTSYPRSYYWSSTVSYSDYYYYITVQGLKCGQTGTMKAKFSSTSYASSSNTYRVRAVRRDKLE